jgi:hypothetical protein
MQRDIFKPESAYKSCPKLKDRKKENRVDQIKEKKKYIAA